MFYVSSQKRKLIKDLDKVDERVSVLQVARLTSKEKLVDEARKVSVVRIKRVEFRKNVWTLPRETESCP